VVAVEGEVEVNTGVLGSKKKKREGGLEKIKDENEKD
jgi:hypothetical protein